MFKDEFLIPFQNYIRKSLRLILFVSIVSFLLFNFLEWVNEGLVSNVFDVNLFLVSGLGSLILVILDYSNQNSSSTKVGVLNNRERLWLTLIAISVGVWVLNRLEQYGLGAWPLSLATTIFSFFFLRAVLEKPSQIQNEKKV